MSNLNYEKMMQRALQGVIIEALGEVAKKGLTGNNHFYISFSTQHPGVILPDWLKEQYPDYLTIVLQHEFYDLAVMNDRFSVSLSFSDRLVSLVVPINSIITFADPSAEFGLKFDLGDREPVAKEKKITSKEPDDDTPCPSASDVIRLDSFRKNHKKD